MKLEDQVVSLELAKRLKELGVKQESLFCWDYVSTEDGDDEGWEVVESDIAEEGCFSAFTVAELFDGLPEKVQAIKVFDGYVVGTNGNFLRGHCEREESLADALTKYKIYLIEQGLVKP